MDIAAPLEKKAMPMMPWVGSHPGRKPAGMTGGARLGDRLVMERLEAIGSPQRSSQIIPIGKNGTVRFNSSGTYTS